jgi:hypothetical protein
MKTIIVLLNLLFFLKLSKADEIQILIKKQILQENQTQKWTEKMEFDVTNYSTIFPKEQIRVYIDWVLDQIKQGFIIGKIMIYDGYLLSWTTEKERNKMKEEIEVIEIRINDKIDK